MDENIFGCGINPLLHSILLLRPSDSSLADPVVLFQDAIRLGLILSLAEVLRRWAVYQVFSHIHVAKIRTLFSSHSEEESRYSLNQRMPASLRMWILMMAGSEASNTQRPWFQDEIGSLALKMGIRTWEELKESLQSVVWIDCVHSDRCRSIWDGSIRIISNRTHTGGERPLPW